MAKIKVHLSIGYSGANREDVLDVDDSELNACETEEKREELLNGYAMDLAWNYIEVGFWLKE